MKKIKYCALRIRIHTVALAGPLFALCLLLPPPVFSAVLYGTNPTLLRITRELVCIDKWEADKYRFRFSEGSKAVGWVFHDPSRPYKFHCRIFMPELNGNTYTMYTYRSFPGQDCPDAYADDGMGQCVPPVVQNQLTCSSPGSGPVSSVGDPIMVATGNSFQTEVDYQSLSPFGLQFIRYYNSDTQGSRWRHNYSQRLHASSDKVFVFRQMGQVYTFTHHNNLWQSDPGITSTLSWSEAEREWLYTLPDGAVETYNDAGQLIQITNTKGNRQQFYYALFTSDGGDGYPDTLDKITNVTGESLFFNYYINTARIKNIVTAEGYSIEYRYNEKDNLSAVVYSDDTPADDTDNPTRFYHYEDETYPHNLTGLTDEAGSRVTWAYDSEGRAISSELDGGVDKSTLVFNTDGSVITTNPLGKQTTYHFANIFGARKVTQVEGHPSTNCLAANKNYSYDTNSCLQDRSLRNSIT